MLRLASLTSDGTGTVGYGYDTYGKLTSISRSTTVYSFTYDQWGNIVDTKVGNITLSTNAYDEYGRLESVTYGNGFVTEYVYDSLDRTDEIKQGATGNTVLTYKFIYNGEGDLYELRNYKTHRSTFFEYDHAGRCMASTEKSFTGTGVAVTYTGILSGYRYEYDANNNLSKLICRMGNEEEPSWATTYVYDKDNRPTEILLDNGKKIINTYDAIGRVTSRDLKNGNTTILGTTITYAPGANGSKTALVATYQNGTDDAYNYAYDENGNIIQIWRGSGTFDSAPEKYSYEYDAANQLVRENLYYGSGNTNNATYVYTYDQWGNILTKKRHLYTTGTPGGNGLLLGSYSYTNSQWGDLLTSYNGSTITYDAMGNPTSYLGKTLTWEGKQLTGYSYSSTNISYAYNEDGLRLQKIVNNETTEYCYNGSVLIGMKIGTGNTAKILRFSYDASGNAAAVDYSADNGSTFTTYYYIRNAQSDIVKLIDNSGNTVVEYLYDSWGKSISVTGTLATTLGADQPFRYRGYVYDVETGWYYLQSRYYDSNTCRFISADIYLSTGQNVLGHNGYSYCLNNPIIRVDNGGNCSKIIEWLIEWLKDQFIVKYDVPLYSQKGELCWAYSQTMIESYQMGVVLSQDEADARAYEIAVSVHGPQDWDQPGWPTNVLPDGAADVYIDSIKDLYSMLKEYGPVYSYYCEYANGLPEGYESMSVHLVVVTGVNLITNTVYTNNPWGIKGAQSFSEFKKGYTGSNTVHELQYCLFPLKKKRKGRRSYAKNNRFITNYNMLF